jgi:RNA polymerase sigma-70 factor (ECF subfamily)
LRRSSWDVTIHEKTHRPGAARLDSSLVEALLAGDESAFGTLVKRYNRAMIRLAMAYVPSQAIAEEVAQEAWLAMVRGLSGFKGQSSLKTWLFGILLNHAKTKGIRENRSIPFSALETPASKTPNGQEVDWLKLREGASEILMPAWGRSSLGLSPEDRALGSELRLSLEQAISLLPAAQRAVIVLRDVEGWTTGEVCDLLGITPENQRVRLHRARLRIRKALESYLSRS